MTDEWDTDDQKKPKRPPVIDEVTGKILLDEQYEMYCQGRSQGYGKSQSFRLAGLHEGIKMASVGPMACELEARAYIAERINQIKEERAAVAKFSESREESIARWNDLYAYGKSIGGKEGIKLQVDAQKQLDKIMAFDQPTGQDPSKKERLFVGTDDWQENAKKALNVINPEHTKPLN